MTQIDKIKEILDTFNEVEFAYLFGSYANNTFTQKSDIDIAIYLKKNYNTFDTKLKIHHKLEIALHKEIDLLVLNEARNFSLIQEILDNNIVLKDSSLQETRAMYELDKYHEILDYQAFQKMIDAA